MAIKIAASTLTIFIGMNNLSSDRLISFSVQTDPLELTSMGGRGVVHSNYLSESARLEIELLDTELGWVTEGEFVQIQGLDSLSAIGYGVLYSEDAFTGKIIRCTISPSSKGLKYRQVSLQLDPV